MPIVSKKPLVTPPVIPNPPQIVSPEIKNNLVDTKKIPVSNLVTNIEGSKWVVDIYTQVINRDDALAGHDTGQLGIYQQYKLIKGFELKVSSPLTTSQNPESKSMSATGSAHCHSLVILNHGDVFLADVGDGRLGIFQITLTEKKSLFTDSVYYIEYALIDFLDSQPSLKIDLDRKVVTTLNYVKDYLNYGQNPLITDKEFEALNKLEEIQRTLIESYYRWFFDLDRKTLLVPGQDVGVYDHYLVKFVLAILENGDSMNVRKTKIYNVQDDPYLSEPTIFDVILNRSPDLLNIVVNKTCMVSTRLFTMDPMLEGIRYSRVPYVVYPKNMEKIFGGLTSRLEPKISAELSLQNVPSRVTGLENLIQDNIVDNVNNQPKIYPVLKDDYYVLSESFYISGQAQSKLENLVTKFIKRDTVNAVEVLDVSKDYMNWGGLERFYYIPLIIAMSKYLLFRSN
jgi:hypothetical protein